MIINNLHFIGFNTSEERLNELDEKELITQIMFWAHALDKLLCYERSNLTGGALNMFNRLNERLKLYKEKFGGFGKAYEWAVRIKELYETAISKGSEFSYPGHEKVSINISCDEFEKLIKTRRSVRAFTGELVDIEQIKKIVEYASWAPSSCHLQALRYVLVGDPVIKNSINTNGLKGELAGCIIVVLADMRFYPDDDIECSGHDSGAAIQNILLSCHYMGLGGCYASSLSLDSNKNRTLFRVKEYEKITALVWIGHYEKTPPAPQRYSLDDILRLI